MRYKSPKKAKIFIKKLIKCDIIWELQITYA